MYVLDTAVTAIHVWSTGCFEPVAEEDQTGIMSYVYMLKNLTNLCTYTYMYVAMCTRL